MDWTAILTAILTFIGGGGLGAVLMFPQKRKSAELENETKASEQWKELYERSEKSRDGRRCLFSPGLSGGLSEKVGPRL